MPSRYDSDDTHVYGVYKYPQYPFDIAIVTSPSTIRQFFYILVVIIILFISAATLMFIRYSNKIIHDINYCLNAMNTSIDNNFQSELHVNRKDEISVIADRINYLIARIRKLIHMNIRQQISAKSTQLIALQHQINPHFLYNTMEIFSSRMELSGLYQESSAMASFCRILRYNINSDTLFATLDEELLQVRHYISIQEIKNIKVELELDIPEEIQSVNIIKFVLQPLIENSFKHRKNNDSLYIRITAFRENHTVHIKVQDNGVGISDEQLEQLNSGFAAESREVFHADQGIGLFNINERMKLFYGKEYAIQAMMEDGLTTFIIRIRDNLSPFELPLSDLLHYEGKQAEQQNPLPDVE